MEIADLYQLFSKSTGVCTDTRNIKKDGLFFALKGENFNGNEFAAKAVKEGASFAIVDEKRYADFPEAIWVADVLGTLQDLASFHRDHLNIPVIAVTGSNGKTTSKELLNAVLSKQYAVAYTQGNLNNHIGVPLTLLEITQEHTMALIEMGDNHPKEVALLCEIAKPNFGFVTNVGKDHLEGFGSFENNVLAKKEVFDWLVLSGGIAFIDYSDKLVKGMVIPKMETISYGQSGCFSFIENKGANPLVMFESENGIAVTTHLFGGFNFNNIKLAYSIGKYFEVSESHMCDALADFQPDNNRSQVVQSSKNTLIMDAYNANPSSVWEAVKSLSEIETEMTKMVLLGDMFELGSFSAFEHQEMIEKVSNCHFELAVFVGENYAKTNYSEDVNVFFNKEETEVYLKKIAPEGAIILLKGSRGMRMETFTGIL